MTNPVLAPFETPPSAAPQDEGGKGIAVGALVLMHFPKFSAIGRVRERCLTVVGLGDRFYRVEQELGPDMLCLDAALWDLSIVQDRPRCHLHAGIGRG